MDFKSRHGVGAVLPILAGPDILKDLVVQPPHQFAEGLALLTAPVFPFFVAIQYHICSKLEDVPMLFNLSTMVFNFLLMQTSV